MKKYLHYLTSLLLACVLATSCEKTTSNETITEQTLTNCFAYVSDFADGPAAYYSNMGFKVRLNYTKPSADITISGLKLTDGTAYPTFTITDLKFAIDKDGWIVLTGEDITPSIPGVAVSPAIGKFSMRLYQRIVGDRYNPAFCVEMTLDRRYTVVSAQSSQICFGTTKSISDTMAPFETKETEYSLSFNIDTRCVNIAVHKAQFMSKMPAMDIVLKNIPFIMQGSKAIFSIDNIVPESNNTPYPAFPISNLKGELDFGSGFDFEFDCAPTMFHGTVFHVAADCGYVPE